MGGAKGVLSIIGVCGLAPPCTIIGVLIGVGSESGAVLSLATSDCILTDLGLATLLGVCLAGVYNVGIFTIFSDDDFLVTLGTLDFDWCSGL